MSQRGSHRITVHKFARLHWWAPIRNCIAFTLLLTFGISFSLPAQDTNELPKPSVQVTLRVDGDERDVTFRGRTVANLLVHARIVLGKYDEVAPPAATQLEAGMAVQVFRKTFQVVEEKVILPPPVISRWDHRMTTRPVVLREGKPGVAVQKRCIWKKDGVVSVQWTQGRKVLTPPTPTIVKRGNIPSRGNRALRMVATAYDPGPASCGRYASGHTAIGMHATKGVIAVDPRIIPLGSRVFIEGYGPAIAADVGSAIKGNRIDVCFATRREALNWGRRVVMVTIYE